MSFSGKWYFSYCEAVIPTLALHQNYEVNQIQILPQKTILRKN
jgi:hypothetical protein